MTSRLSFSWEYFIETDLSINIELVYLAFGWGGMQKCCSHKPLKDTWTTRNQ